MTLLDWREGLDAGDLSPVALVRECLARMDRLEPTLNAVISTEPARSLDLARGAEARLRAGERGPLLGLPVVLKDNLNWTGSRTTCGSRILEGYRSPFDATVVARLLEAGAIPVAKANMDEFAMGSSGEYSAFGPTRNPWDPDRVPGGSSSGSVVSVAAGYAPFALGSDTGGSVRLPAAFCGVTALRPTYGVTSRYGLAAMASSLDQVGPVARSAADLAPVLQVLAGPDPRDATSVELPRREALHPLQPADLKGLRVGLPREYFAEGLTPAVGAAVLEAARVLESRGATLVDLSLPHTRHAIDTYYLLCTAEVSSNLARYDGVRYGLRAEADGPQEMMALTRDRGFGPEVKRRILLGTFGLSRGYYDAFYLKAMKARSLVARDFARAFEAADLLLTPTSPVEPFAFGERSDPLAMYLADVYSVAMALAGLPVVALPAGFAGGLPTGFQLVAPPLADVRLLEAAHAYQLATDHHRAHPPLAP